MPAAPTRAASLAERRRTPGPDRATASADNAAPGIAVAATDSRLEKAARRLDRWRAQPPFDTYWAERLRADTLTEEELRALLAEPDDALAARLGDPGWARDLAAAYEEEPPPQSDEPLTPILDPVLARARARLAAELSDVDGAGRYVELLYPPLPHQLNHVVTRCLVLELNIARLLDDLPGETPEERFAAFRVRLCDPAYRRHLLGEYPVLFRLAATIADQWVTTSATFVRRLLADRADLTRTFGELGAVTAIRTGLGDAHRGGQTVSTVDFAGGVTLVYKPRPVAVDVHFQDLLRWLDRTGATPGFRTLTYLDRGTYGWSEFVRPAPASGPDGLHRFYHRQGGLLALLHVLCANDFHAENLIAAGEHPVLIDLESLIQPDLLVHADGAPEAELLAVNAAAASVLRIGLLPFQAWQTASGSSVDVSGLGGGAGDRLTPIALPYLAEEGTDRMSVRLRRQTMGRPANRPVDDGTTLRVLDYADDIVAGFTEVYQVCAERRDDLLAPGGPVTAFTGDEVRVILRATMQYEMLRHTAYHPDVLRDGLELDRHLDRLWKDVARRPALAAAVEHERADLWRHDIPVFTARTDETDLRASTGAPLPGLVGASGLANVTARLRGLGPDDLARQRWLIRGALATTAVDVRGVEYPGYRPPPLRADAAPDRLVAHADRIGRYLAGIAYRSDGAAEWLGVQSNQGENWSLSPLGADLFHGLSGIALFLAHLGATTGDRAHTALARDAFATARSQVARDMVGKVGGMAGLGGLVYAATHLGVLWDDPGLLDYAASLVPAIAADAARDTRYDFVAGSAGSIAGLAALAAVRPGGALTDALAACADALVRGARPAGSGAAWLGTVMVEERVADVPMAGVSHGAAGIVWPLLYAAGTLGDTRCTDTARAGLAYERDLFLPAAGNWQDVRRGGSGPGGTLVAWCAGAAGIGISRLLSLPHLDTPDVRADLDTALDTTRRRGFGMNHSLCHGDLGNLDLLLLAADRLHRADLAAEVRLRAGSVLDSIDADGWICGVPTGVEAPGLMTGIAGTGLQLLRLADPTRIPSVLAFEPPRLAP